VQMYDIDMFDNDASVVASLHHKGRKVVCYIDVGTWENWRPDAKKFPKFVLGKHNGWPGEKWLDIRSIDILGPIMQARMDLCQAKGFDAMVETARLVEAVGDADYVINILPGGPQNAGMIGAAVFAAMKSTAFFINVGRGETVDEQALIAVLRDRRIAGAGLDVFNTEPLPAESPLWDLPNAFICPHIGGMFAEYEDCVVPILTGNLRLFLAGRTAELRNVVPH